MDYKNSGEYQFVREFSESTSPLERFAIIKSQDEIEKIVEIKFSVFTDNCRAIKEMHEAGSMDVKGLFDTVSLFFSRNRLIIMNQNIDVSPYIDILNEFEIGNVLFDLLALDPADPDLINLIDSAVHFIAILAYFPARKFNTFLEGARLYPIMFNLFCRTDVEMKKSLIIDILSVMINLSYTEENEEDSFAMFAENPIEATRAFITSYNHWISVYRDLEFKYPMRVLVEIAKKKAKDFVDSADDLVYFIREYLEEDSFFYVLKFLTYIMNQTKSPDISKFFYEKISEKFFCISQGNIETQGQEFIYFNILFSVVEDPNFAINIASHTYLFKEMKRLLFNGKISHIVFNLLKSFVTIGQDMMCFGGTRYVTMFELFINTEYGNSFHKFILDLEKEYDSLNVHAKEESFCLLAKLLDFKKYADYIIDGYDFESLALILESGSKDLSISAIEFIFACLSAVGRKSPEAVRELIDKFDNYDIPSIFEELSQNEDPDISERASRVIDTVHYYVGDSDDESDGD